jgi:hypothetical protein
MPWLSRRGERRRNGLLRTLLQLSCQTLIRQEDNAMNSVNYLIPAAIATFSLAGAVGANAEDRFHEPNRYAATNLVSDLAGKAKVRDPILQNAWGVAFSPAPSPFWISDNATGCSTLYDGVIVAGHGSVGPGRIAFTVTPVPAMRLARPCFFSRES